MRGLGRRVAAIVTVLKLWVLLGACGEPTAAPQGLAETAAAAQTVLALPDPTPLTPPLAAPPRRDLPPVAPATPAPPAPPLAEPTAAALAGYRALMEEARLLHPYAEPIDKMWAVMLCESSGNASVIAGLYHGLFQYSAATWGGAWNPYRDQPILDPRAQIFATAKAWQDGHQLWWTCYSLV